MTSTVTTKTGYGTRVGGAFKGILAGLVFFAAGTVLLWWNEGRAVRTRDAIEEAAGALVEFADPSVHDAAFEGKLVHACARASANGTLSDARFGVTAPEHALSLSTRSEIYQWVETRESKSEKKLGGSVVTTTVYDYECAWRPLPESSAEFKESGHENTQILPTGVWEGGRIVAKDVSFGAYRLPESFIASLSFARAELLPVEKTAEEIASLQAALFGVPPTPVAPPADPPAEAAEVPADGAAEAPAAAEAANPAAPFVPRKVFLLGDGTLYIGLDPSAPAIGDVRVSFAYVPETDASLIARVKGDTFGPFLAANGTPFSRIATGTLAADEMIANARQGNRVTSWLLRLAGWFLLFLAVRMVLAPLAVIGDVVPFIGSILRFGTGLVAFAVATPWALTVIAIAWIRFRPLLGAGLLVLAAAIVAFVFLRKRKQPAT
jgi:hypothetical protein